MPARAMGRFAAGVTLRGRAVPPPAMHPAAAPPPHMIIPPQLSAAPARPIPAPRKRQSRWPLYLGGAVLSFVLCGVMAAALMAVIIYGGGVLSGVTVAGISVGGMSEAEAAAHLRQHLTALTFIDAQGETWAIPAAEIGVTFDYDASAAQAYAQGRGEGEIASALSGVNVAPVFIVDTDAAREGFEGLRAKAERAAVNAGVMFANGQVQARPAVTGRALDAEAALNALIAPDAFSDGTLLLTFRDVTPTVTDSTALVEAARTLLANPFTVRVFDPVTGDSVIWQAAPEQWAAWLTGEADAASPTGLKLTLDSRAVVDFLEAQAAVFDSSRYLEITDAVPAMQAALDRGVTSATLRVRHHDRSHIVQAGETIISIAWDYGVPYPWVQKANGGIENVSIGQTLIIPSADNFFYHAPMPDKRVVVSISKQRVWVYENGAVKWDWVASTGINSSPTWPGLYQIISHEPNAYAANWNLNMPYFMGVYQPIPGADFTNGFHGFPTRGGGQILWENSLGTRVTYGCILLSNTNAAQLYEWAEDGVIVEIKP